jgi:NAD(P)-dependent dehydrogenase (short-subunit alcohol dehydrogenase family)
MIVNNDNKSEFLNKRVIITGASSGVGKACAHYFLNSGAKVILCGRDIETLKQIGEKYPNQAAAINLDLSDDLHIYDFKTSVIEILGGIDIVVNCAGVLFDGDIEKTFPQDYDYTIDVNLRAVFSLILYFKQYMSKGSSIVNVSCIYGTKPQAGMSSFCVSKAGLESLTKFAAAELAEFGIRVNAVSACPIDTNCQRYVGVGDKEYLDFKTRVSKNIPLGRMAKPDDVAKSIIFLASKRSSKITGQIMKVDGGRSLTTSGFVQWRGMKNMNARFEPDDVSASIKLKEFWGKFSSKKEENVKFPTSEKEIEDLVKTSNWNTNSSEAHGKVTANYKNIDQNDDFLQSKFVNKK